MQYLPFFRRCFTFLFLDSRYARLARSRALSLFQALLGSLRLSLSLETRSESVSDSQVSTFSPLSSSLSLSLLWARDRQLETLSLGGII